MIWMQLSVRQMVVAQFVSQNSNDRTVLAVALPTLARPLRRCCGSVWD